jgi:hypothetical protein
VRLVFIVAARNEPRNQGNFSAAIEQMIHACDVQVEELKNMPLDGVAEMVKPAEQRVLKTFQVAFTNV